MMKNSFIPSSIQLARRDKREVDMEAEFLRFDHKMTKLVEKIIKWEKGIVEVNSIHSLEKTEE